MDVICFKALLLAAFLLSLACPADAQSWGIDGGSGAPSGDRIDPDAGEARSWGRPQLATGLAAEEHSAVHAEIDAGAVVPPVVHGLDGSSASADFVEVEVRTRSRADTLRRSALAISVVDLKEAKRGAADLGDVLARVEGVAVRRAGGLGSDQRLSLAGLEGEQIRFFLDGIPLVLAGFPFGVSNVPADVLERVEIYRGVVPIRLGADALGGAMNLVTAAPREGTHGSASYQGGSFDTHRGVLSVTHMRDGLFAQVGGFADSSRNDYRVTVDVPSANGVPARERVHRFHDGYRAEGAHVTLGVVDQGWAKRLQLRTFFTDYERDIQNDVRMAQAYGAATSGGLSTGSTLTYEQAFGDALVVDTSVGYAFGITRLRDMARCTYNWLGQCTPAPLRGEVDDFPGDTRLEEHAVFARTHARYRLAQGHVASVSLAPTHQRRGGDDRYEPRPGARDPLDVDRRLTSLVIGAEYALQLLDEKLELSAFGKAYLQWVRSEELLRDGENSVRRDRDTARLGAGLTARYAFIDELWLKGSYEYATRLPNVDEVFGNGVTIDPSLQLAPEVSHNGNLTLACDVTHARAGRFFAELNGFVRDADQLINLVGVNVYRYLNVARARSLGGSLGATWTAPNELLRIGGNTTYQDFRNRATVGDAARFAGDRMPNVPYLFANGSVRGQLRDVFGTGDALALTWSTRYTHSFFRSWESAGLRATKDVIPHQLVHALSLTHLVKRGRNRSFSTTLELQNLTDARVFDFFGVERPGRAVFAKAVAEL